MKIIVPEYRKYFPLLIMASLLLSMGLIVWLGIIPFQKYITEKADGIQEYYTTRENRERQIGTLPDLQKRFESIVADEQTLDILLSEEKIVDFVKMLEGIAQETNTGITIQAKEGSVIQEKKTATPVAKKLVPVDGDEGAGEKKEVVTLVDSLPYERYLRINVVVVGEYWNIISFLHKMETLPYGLDVISVSIRTRDQEDQKKYQVSVSERNPFMLISEGSTALGEGSLLATAYEGMTGALEASFDTAVYLRK